MARTALGAEAFQSLQAEEEPWVVDCYIPPPQFDFMTVERSVVVFGAPGSGKTALARALFAAGQTNWLMVEWLDTHLRVPSNAAGGAGTPGQRMLAFTALALARRLAAESDRYTKAGPDIQAMLHWFIHGHFPAKVEWVDRLVTEGTASSRDLVRSFLLDDPLPMLSDTTSPRERLAWLIEDLRRIGLKGIWAVADGSGNQGDAPSVVAELLDAVWIFKIPGLTLKLILPDDYQNMVFDSEAIKQNSFDHYALKWALVDSESDEDVPRVEQLIAIVEARIALALGLDQFNLTQLCQDRRLIQWLYRIGGVSPKGWLTVVRPLAKSYIDQATSKRRPLTPEQWKDIRRSLPVQIRLAQGGMVIVGFRAVEGLSETESRILTHLLTQRPHLVSRDELYRQVFPNQEATGRGDLDRAPIDTALSRLRKALEPLPGESKLFVTQRNRGVRIDSL